MMKKIAYLLFAAMTLTACEKVTLIDDEDISNEQSTGKTYKVTVMTRAATSASDLVYPVQIKATDASGKVVAQQQLNSSSDDLKLSLPNGKYTISAISGSGDFQKGYSTKPMLIGNSDVAISNANANVNIIMSYAVASIDVTMADVPSDVKSMSVSLSPLYTDIATTGTYSGSGSVTLPCTKDGDGKWTTGTLYVLPGSSSNTVMSLMLTTSSGSDVYGVTYPSPLKAATPYHFSGTYSGTASPSDFSITGTLQCEGWGSDVSDSFIFGPSGNNSFGDNPGDAIEAEVSALPEAGAVWNGHVVGYIDGKDALLISAQEWTGLTSALNEADPDVAKNIAAAYTEGSLSHWAIPTSDQARLLKTQWTPSTYTALNQSLESIGGTGISIYDNDKAVRYLCADAGSTFSFAANSSILAAGATVKTYRLRLVKAVHFKVK